MEEQKHKILKVGSATNVGKLAGAIVKVYEEDPKRHITLSGIGAGAVNQSVKAIIVANKQFIRFGIVATILPAFSEDTGKKDEITALIMRLKMFTI